MLRTLEQKRHEHIGPLHVPKILISEMAYILSFFHLSGHCEKGGQSRSKPLGFRPTLTQVRPATTVFIQ